MTEKKARKNPRPRPRSFYLGDNEAAEKRIKNLDEIAARFGVTRSVLLQKIADRELLVVKSPKADDLS